MCKKQFDIFKPQLVIMCTNGINVPLEDVEWMYPNSRIVGAVGKWFVDVYPRIINLKKRNV